MLKRVLDALWPRGSAWMQKVGGGMEGLLLGIADTFDTVRDKLATLADVRNATRTEQLDELEIDFGILPDSALSDAIRRARLDSRINTSSTAGTRDRLEREIRAAGFDLYVYANSPAVNPAQFGSIYRAVAGNPKIVAGNPQAIAGIFNANLLVNGAQERTVSVWRMVAGGAKAFAGNPQALAGRVGITTLLRTYAMPVDSTAWPFIFFVGGIATHNVSGELTSIAIAEVPDDRRAELEETVLRLKGTYTWAVMVVHYT